MTDDDDVPTRQELPSPRWDRKTVDATLADEPAPSAFDPAIAERYTVTEELGRGGMGRVVAATDSALARGVAIKQSLSDRAEDLARFEREVRITAKLEHPSITPIYDAGRDSSGHPYYVMRRLQGQPLSDLVTRAKTQRDRLALVPNVVAAVDAAAFAHARRIIHRDIKPWNILVGDYGETLLIDWGLARELDAADDVPASDADQAPGDALTRAGRAYGTPGYMAPEQARGEPVDERIDVYALGATLLHVLSGVTPYDGSSATEWIQRASKGVTPKLELIGPEVPRELVAIVAKAMANVKTERYRDASELATDLRAFLAGQLVAAHRYTVGERVRRFVRRHRVAVAVATIAVVALGIGGAIAITNVVEERGRTAAAQLEAHANEQLANDRLQRRLLDRASRLVATDPTRALAVLRQLPAGSPHAGRARDIAAIAAAGGIAHGRAAHTGFIHALAVSPDGRWIASGGADGTLQIHDVVRATSRILFTGKHVENLTWIDGGAGIAFSSGYTGLHAVTLASGAVRTLAADASVYGLWTPARDDRVRYYDRQRHAVIECATSDGAERVIAGTVEFVVADGDVTLVGDHGTLRLMRAGGDLVLATHPRLTSSLGVAISGDHTRAVGILGDEVVEWELATGREHQRWPIRNALIVDYTPGGPIATQFLPNAMVHRLLDGGASPMLSGNWSTQRTAPTSLGTAFVTNEGKLSVITADGPRFLVLERTGIRSIGGNRGSSVVAVGTADGELMWWNLRDVMPIELAAPAHAELCAVDARTVFMQAATDLVAVPRDGSPPRILATRDTMQCTGVEVGTELAVLDPLGAVSLVDTVTGGIAPLAGTGAIDMYSDTVFVVRAGRLVEQRGGASIDRGAPPTDLVKLVAARDWLAVVRPGEIVRIDRMSGTRTTFAGAPTYDYVELGEDGTPWFASGRRVYRALAGRAELVVELPTKVSIFRRLPDYGVTIMTEDSAIWAVTRDGTESRAPAAAGDRKPWFGFRTAATRESAQIFATRYLDTGETITRSVPRSIVSLAGSRDERTIAVQVGSNPRVVELFEDRVPADPALLSAWIDTATNASVSATTDVLTWR
ncbi:MAG: protein kinase [Kofleriaceae bacterium]